jgi:hypothetical protein
MGIPRASPRGPLQALRGLLAALVLGLLGPFLPGGGLPGQVNPPAVVTGRVLLADPQPRPYDGILYLELYLDASRPAAYLPQELTVVPVKATAGVIAIPLSYERITIRRAFIPERTTAEVNVPVPPTPGGVLGEELVLGFRTTLHLFQARVVDARSGLPVPRARFLFDDRDHRTLSEEIQQRPEKRPGVPIHTATDQGEIILPTDDDPFRSPHPINLSLFDPAHVTVTVAARPLLREAVHSAGGLPVVLPMEPGGIIAGHIGPQHAIAGAELPHVRFARADGPDRSEMRVLLDPGGNFRLTGLPAGRYEIRYSHGLDRIDLKAGQTAQLLKD